MESLVKRVPAVVHIIGGGMPLLLVLKTLDLYNLFRSFLTTLFSITLLICLLIATVGRGTLSLFLGPIAILTLTLPIICLLYDL